MAIRVYQVAKEYNKKPEEIIDLLNKSGIDVDSKTSKLDEHALHTLRAKLGTFKLTVVDGDEESPVKDEGTSEAKPKKKASPKKKAKKAEEPKPKLAVRVIKKHDEPEKKDAEEAPEPAAASAPEEAAPAAEPEAVETASAEAEKEKKPLKPKLKKPKARLAKIEKRISKIAEKVSTGSPSEEKPPIQPNEKGVKIIARRKDRARVTPPEAARQDRTARGRNDRRGSRDSFHRQGGPGAAPPSGAGRPPGGGGGRPPGGGGGRPPGGGGGRPPGGGRPGGGRPGGGRPGGRGGRGPNLGPDLINSAVKTPEQAAAKAGGQRQNRFAVGRPGARKKKRKKKNQENMAKVRHHAALAPSKVELPDKELGIIMLSEGVTVKELAEKVNRMAKDVIKRLFEKGVMATLNDVLESDLAIDLAKDFGYLAEIVTFEEDLQMKEDENLSDVAREQIDTSGKSFPRAPIVTIMGHVDHGKTTLLDAVRTSKVASGEAGGITQHIGAYAVEKKDKRIVFLDTPGHEAFTKMRARGASVTDIVILVVAADDGVKPQTIEAINHAKAAKVPIIVCINKMDKPDANPERVKQMLTEHDLIVEDFGGDSPSVNVSAKQLEGIDDLLDMILLVADLNEYTANPERRARGTVIEARLDRGRGPVATVIVQDGTLRVGDYFITGQTNGRIRAMHDEHGKAVDFAGPSMPVEILGLNEVPSAGDSFLETEDEATARKIAGFRQERAREEHLGRNKHTSLDQLFKSLDKDEIKELPIIIKGDVHGSVEGIMFALNKIKSEKVNLRFVHHGVGNITENDVLLAVAADAIVIGFNVKSEGKAERLAEQEGIEVRLYDVIYEVVKDMETAMLGLVAPTLEEREIGRATILQVFSVARLGKVAGCKVDSGVIKRNAKVRVFRKDNQIHEGELQTLKRFQDDVNEVKAGYECGIGIKNFNDIEEGDVLAFHVMEEVRATEL